MVWQVPWTHLYHLPACWAVGPGKWRRALPFPFNEGPRYGWSCSETEGTAMPSTTVVVCGLRTIYNLLFHFMHVRDFFNITLLTYYVKSMHLYVCFSVCNIGCLACKHAGRRKNKYDSLCR